MIVCYLLKGEIMETIQLSTKSCETTFNVDGNILVLFIITGGIPAIQFDDYSFRQSYPSIPKWSDENFIYQDTDDNGKFIQSHYSHQDPNNIQGPTFDVLPNGLEDVKAFLDKHLPLKQLREKRFSQLPIREEIKSKPVLDKEEHTKVTCYLNLRKNYIPPVTFSPKIYGGRCDDRIVLFSDWWKKTQSIFNPLFDSEIKWEDLDEQKYVEICNHLKEYKGE